MSFSAEFPKTTKLLASAQPEIFPACAVGVSFRGQDHFTNLGCGPNSLFDLASITKVACTTTVLALAEQKKLLSTTSPLKQFFPTFADARVHLSHLLEHSSGLPWWLPLHNAYHAENGRGGFDARTTPGQARAQYEAEIIKSHNPAEFEKQAVYSDLGFMMLGWALEKGADAPLDALFQEWVVQPAGLESFQFLPVSPDVVPTENCPWRARVLRGEVHDDNCYVLGGIAGHAGVFGNVGDTLKFGKLWLMAVLGNPLLDGWLTTDTARKFWQRSTVHQSVRSLGWDGVSPKDSAAGKLFSPEARGHLGFTGTSLWVDPGHKLVVTLLTNRVHPTRTNEKIKAFRPLFHDTLLSELGIG
ncbi:MAG: serine hydrolase [Deltaproteobacteria bacterium]|nr:serine hydrolase [Deltaproteobacteria bacterium]